MASLSFLSLSFFPWWWNTVKSRLCLPSFVPVPWLTISAPLLNEWSTGCQAVYEYFFSQYTKRNKSNQQRHRLRYRRRLGFFFPPYSSEAEGTSSAGCRSSQGLGLISAGGRGKRLSCAGPGDSKEEIGQKFFHFIKFKWGMSKMLSVLFGIWCFLSFLCNLECYQARGKHWPWCRGLGNSSCVLSGDAGGLHILLCTSSIGCSSSVRIF